ncbi:MAG: hypothetical protein ABS920_10415 [Sporosarcina sp.]
MLKYVILLAVAILVFPILIFIVRRKRLGNWIIFCALAGLFISIIGLLMQGAFNPLHVVLVMFGLAFAIAVLLDRQPRQVEEDKMKRRTMDSLPTTLEPYREDSSNEVASSLEIEEDFTIQQSEIRIEKGRPDGE